MSTFDHGPLQSFEITWMTGHVETIQGHQVTWPNSLPNLFDAHPVPNKPRICIHGEIDGRWVLQLSVLEEDIRSIRNVATEMAPDSNGGA